MTCYQKSTAPQGIKDAIAAGRTSYATEAECLQACKEGACCEGTTCSVKPQCQCQGTGKTFKGVGTTCDDLKGACCDGDLCVVKTECECRGDNPSVAWKGIGTTCDQSPCPKCGWVWKLPAVLTVTVSNCQDNFYGTDFASMNGTYTLPLESRSLVMTTGFARYRTFPGDGKQVAANIDCDAQGRVRYSAFAGTQRIYGADGNAFGPFLESANKCFTTSFSGGNQQFLSCFFQVSCENPLP